MLSGVENIKNSKSRFVRISSEDKVSGTNNKFVINLESSGGAIDNVKGFIVHSAQVPNIFDNINSRNNRVRIDTFATVPIVDILVDPCYYTLTDLVNYLNTTIAAIIPAPGFTSTFAVTGNFPCQKISYTMTGTGSVFLEFTENNIWETLGFVNPGTPNGIQVTNGSTVVATNPPNLIGETECYIHSRVLCPSNLVEANGAFSVVDKINLDEPYGSMCYTNYNNDTTHMMRYFPYESRKTLRTVDINLRTRTGELLELPSNFTFSMMIKIFYS
jgi:hypothetical protein